MTAFAVPSAVAVSPVISKSPAIGSTSAATLAATVLLLGVKVNPVFETATVRFSPSATETALTASV